MKVDFSSRPIDGDEKRPKAQRFRVRWDGIFGMDRLKTKERNLILVIDAFPSWCRQAVLLIGEDSLLERIFTGKKRVGNVFKVSDSDYWCQWRLKIKRTKPIWAGRLLSFQEPPKSRQRPETQSLNKSIFSRKITDADNFSSFWRLSLSPSLCQRAVLCDHDNWYSNKAKRCWPFNSLILSRSSYLFGSFFSFGYGSRFKTFDTDLVSHRPCYLPNGICSFRFGRSVGKETRKGKHTKMIPIKRVPVISSRAFRLLMSAHLARWQSRVFLTDRSPFSGPPESGSNSRWISIQISNFEPVFLCSLRPPDHRRLFRRERKKNESACSGQTTK